MKLLLIATFCLVSAEFIQKQSVFQGRHLRILPLGASITRGVGSSHGNGYRQDLRNLLSPGEVTFIGTQCSGDMQNGNNEGHRSYHIDQMEAVAAPDIALQPNIVLVYVGTNDMLSKQASAAPENMQQLVKYLVASLPDALIVVSKLFLDTRPEVAQKIDVFNSKLDVTNLGNVMVADMSNLLTAADLGHDGEHPNNSGYTKMAQMFFNVLAQAESEGRIASPATIQFTPMCNGPPVVATTSLMGYTSQPEASSTTSAATSQNNITTTFLGTTSATGTFQNSSSSSLASSQTSLTSVSISPPLPMGPTTSQVTASVPTTQGFSIMSGPPLAAASTGSIPTDPLTSDTPTSSAQKLVTNLSAVVAFFAPLIIFALGLWD